MSQVHLRAALNAIPTYTPGRSVAGAIKLASNEMGYPPLPSVIAAITEAAQDMNRYPDNSSGALGRALADRFGVSPDQITVGCGSVALCEQFIQATCGEGDEVIYGWRSFEAYPILTKVVGATAVTAPLLAGEALNLPALAAAITENTRLIFVCNPNNPTGTALRTVELQAFLDQVPPRVLVVIDEAYREFVDDDDVPDGIEIARGRDNVAVLRTMSKAYGLAGLRVGYAVAAPEVTTALHKVALPFSVSTLAQAAALASLESAPELLERCQQVVLERARVRAQLLELGYSVPESQANFVWLPLRDQSAAFAQHCEVAANVIVRAFNDADAGGVRITISRPHENDAFLSAAASFPR
ncbi:histidinol-phosphate transaminase [Nakamurella antarctica]|uniref:Aromatic amino acid aminotransferase n=1 Tax=Nakamurella antarctica TaxID=1902245 RepID=A0A3G8ZRB0_9ACTN|nr:histidinol-phosphate transaminase [Nakamurella antarctica]